MDKLVITPDAYGPFFQGSGNLELCDPEGRTLGYFVRTDSRFEATPEEYEWVKSQISDEELERRRAETGPLRSTAEVLARRAYG